MSKIKQSVNKEETSNEAHAEQKAKERLALETAKAAAEPEIPAKEMAEIEAAEKEAPGTIIIIVAVGHCFLRQKFTAQRYPQVSEQNNPWPRYP